METLSYMLQKFELGVVLLSAENKIQALNDFGNRVLGRAYRGDLLDRSVFQVHPEKSRDKIALLLRSAEMAAKQHEGSPPPVTMLIAIPDRVLHIRVSKLLAGDRFVGTCMLFYDLTDITTGEGRQGKLKLLLKIPAYSGNQTLLVDTDDVTYVEALGHYTQFYTRTTRHFSNLSLSDLEARLDKSHFVRVHKSYLVNIRHAAAIKRIRNHWDIEIQGDKPAHIPVSRTRARELKELLGLT